MTTTRPWNGFLRRDTRARPHRRALSLALAVLAACLTGVPAAFASPSEGIHNIKHVVVIMQENRSFDSYFGTYPGANGTPGGVCVPDPSKGGCDAPYHVSNRNNLGGQHGHRAALADIDGGKMDGFVEQAEKGRNCTNVNPTCAVCNTSTTPACEEVMGYHDAREIPNYWSYAHEFVLQDNMFEASMSASGHSHGYMVSAWYAVCPKGDANPLDCVNSVEGGEKKTHAWTDITYLLAKANVSWRYFIFEGAEPDCESDEEVVCTPAKQSPKTPSAWNELPTFTDVHEDGQLGDIQSLNGFYTAVHDPEGCGLPNVSWIVPKFKVSEHPNASVVEGQAYVTTLINAVMRSPCWPSTAIFLSWDDWGGLYDHVVPPKIDANGYGLRVPGLMVSAYARAGYIDHQQLSHDAYLKFIEDDFLEGARLNPTTDGRADKRPDVREEAPGLGDLASEFDFNQPPRAPVILAARPGPGPASTPPGSAQVPALETAGATGITATEGTLNANVNPDGAEVTSCRFEYGTTTAYGSSAACASLPTGAGHATAAASAPVGELVPGTSYHYRITATNSVGTSLGPDLEFTTASVGAARRGSGNAGSKLTASGAVPAFAYAPTASPFG